ncbi:MAG: HutD family protein [Alphaproteobacteria bacterium]|nr:HutD family protein [Alphaproteobacteria bacterium]
MRIIRLADQPSVPWKNGLGTTVEIARSSGSGDLPAWRLSRAIIDRDAPFSVFPGFVRSLALAEGRGLRLEFAHAPARVLSEQGALARFSGDEAVIGRPIDGPVVALNLMVDPQRATMRDEAMAISGAATIRATLIHVLEGRISVGALLSPGDTLIGDGPSAYRVVAEACAHLFVATIDPR